MQHGRIVRVVVVARVRHRSVDPRRVMRRHLVAERHDRRLRCAAPLDRERARVADGGCARAGSRTRQGVENIGLGGGDHGCGKVAEPGPTREARENRGEVVAGHGDRG
jgi:hypothetical protein